MFHNMSTEMAARMGELEAWDKRDRADGTPNDDRLRQIPRETGKFLALLAASAPPGAWFEIGTSAGYSSMWLSRAAEITGNRITTHEIMDSKLALARETLDRTGIHDLVTVIPGDAKEHLPTMTNIAFCFLDSDKEHSLQYYDTLVPHLVPGGFLVVDNAISHEDMLQSLIDRALADDRVDALVVPIGKGELVCRKL